MSGVLARLGSAFLAPDERSEEQGGGAVAVPDPSPDLGRVRERARRSPPAVAARLSVPPTVGLLCPPDAAVANGVPLALALARRVRSPAALLCAWSGGATLDGLPPVPARAGATRLARSLADRGHVARGVGRVAVVALAADPAQAAAEAERAAAAFAHGPTVLALAGPRDERLDAVLRRQDRLIVAGVSAGLADLALASLAELGVPARASPPLGGGAAGLLAAGGLPVAPAHRAALEQVLEGLG